MGDVRAGGGTSPSEGARLDERNVVARIPPNDRPPRLHRPTAPRFHRPAAPRLHRPAAPRLLDPILRLWEQADRRRRRIRPIRESGVLGLEFGRYNGPRVELSDGTLVRRGDPIAMVHLENQRMREIATLDWQARALHEAREDLRVLAAWAARQPPDVRPRAYTGETLMGPFARRVGFEVRPRPRTARTRLDDWFLRWLIARWSPGGRERLRHGRGAMRSSDVWLSDATLQRRYGGAPHTPDPDPAESPQAPAGA